MKWCLLHYDAGDTTSKWDASHLEFPREDSNKSTNNTQQPRNTVHWKKRRQTQKTIPQEYKTLIKQQYEKTWCGAVYLEKK
ncbi:MAG: hypothetical protein LBI79_05175 [Nitrososphaerota archaeon]|nr:hypothetical protein [Nitrososphaerota archaeon]